MNFNVNSSAKSGVPRIFVSHAWNEPLLYEKFTQCLNEQLGLGNWENNSIPRSRAVDALMEHRNTPAYQRRLREISRLKARLQDPTLPDVSYRFIYEPDGKREAETRGAVQRQLDKFLADNPDEADINLLNDVSENSNLKHPVEEKLFPELAYEIGQRVRNSDCFFILLSEMLQLRRWVNFEVDVAIASRVRTVAVDFGGGLGAYISNRVEETIDWSVFASGQFSFTK